MKSEAIRQLITRWREKDDSEPGWRDWLADEAGACLAALEARIAAKDAAIEAALRIEDIWCPEDEMIEPERIGEMQALASMKQGLEAALTSSPSGKVGVACYPMGSESKHVPFLGWRADATWMICEWRDGALFTVFGYEDITDDPPVAWMPLFWPDDFVPVDREKLREIEWACMGTLGPECPVCESPKDAGRHGDDCWLAALLKEADDG